MQVRAVYYSYSPLALAGGTYHTQDARCWVFGFFVLLSFDLFVEGFVFEWLEWNGITKNHTI